MIPNGQAVLIVEDNEDDLFMLKRAITAAGWRHLIRAVPDGDEAVHYVQGVGAYADRVAHPIPFLVLLDLKLPKRPGHDVLAWVREQSELSGIIVIVFTTSKDPEDVARAYSLGANAYLIKPSSLSELTQTVKAIDAFWIQRNQFAPSLPPSRVQPVASLS